MVGDAGLACRCDVVLLGNVSGMIDVRVDFIDWCLVAGYAKLIHGYVGQKRSIGTGSGGNCALAGSIDHSPYYKNFARYTLFFFSSTTFADDWSAEDREQQFVYSVIVILLATRQASTGDDMR